MTKYIRLAVPRRHCLLGGSSWWAWPAVSAWLLAPPSASVAAVVAAAWPGSLWWCLKPDSLTVFPSHTDPHGSYSVEEKDWWKYSLSKTYQQLVLNVENEEKKVILPCRIWLHNVNIKRTWFTHINPKQKLAYSNVFYCCFCFRSSSVHGFTF